MGASAMMTMLMTLFPPRCPQQSTGRVCHMQPHVGYGARFCNAGLRTAEAGARDSSDAALNPASLPQRISQEESRERLFSFCMQMTGGQKQVLATRSAVRVERSKGCLVRRAMHGPPGHSFFEAWLRQQDAIESDLH